MAAPAPDAPLVEHREPSAPPAEVAGPAAVARKSPLKQTLVGLPPMVLGPAGNALPGDPPSAPPREGDAPPDAPPPPFEAESAKNGDPVPSGRMAAHRKMTLMGVAPPAPISPRATTAETPAPVVVPAAAPVGAESVSAADAPEITVDPTPLETIRAEEIRVDVSDDSGADGEKPTGVAKPYVPKEANTPPVVVEADLLRAGQLAAEAEAAAKRARLQKSRRAPTIPGTLRVQPKGAPIIADIDTVTPDFRPRRSKAPLIAALVGTLAGAGIVGALLLDRAPQPQPEPPAPRAQVQPTADPVPQASVEEIPPPPPPTATETSTAAPPATEAPAPAVAAQPPVPPPKVEAKPRLPRKVAPARKPAPKRQTATSTAPAPKSKPVIVRDTPF